jgi:hypothetical protein
MLYAPLTDKEVAAAIDDLMAVMTVTENTVKTWYTFEELASTITVSERVRPAATELPRSKREEQSQAANLNSPSHDETPREGTEMQPRNEDHLSETTDEGADHIEDVTTPN